MSTNRPGDRRSSWAGLRRIDAAFLRRHRIVMGLALVGMLAQSLLLLPVPLIQGRVIDWLLPLFERGGSANAVDRGALGPAVAMAVGAMLACHVGRMLLGWKVGAMM